VATEDSRREVVPSITWDATGAARVRELVVAAFPASDFADADALVDDPRFDEPRALVEMARGLRWTTIAEDVLVHNRSIASWVSDVGFTQLLPAFLVAALMPSQADLRAATVSDLSPKPGFAGERLERRARLFTAEQRDAIRAWLRFVSDQEPHGGLALSFWDAQAGPAPIA
jgi:hypothetical protein